ncbi:MAG: hypothetical protein ACI4B5_08155, partial [Bacteroidaceae bacterium]
VLPSRQVIRGWSYPSTPPFGRCTRLLMVLPSRQQSGTTSSPRTEAFQAAEWYYIIPEDRSLPGSGVMTTVLPKDR